MRRIPALGTLLRRVAPAACLLVATQMAVAQPISFDKDDAPPTLIPFRAEPKLGDVGRVEGVVDENGRRFYLDELDVMSPLAIQVFAKDPANPIRVTLHRYFWRTPNLEGKTDAAGNWGYVGRVHDEVGIELTAERPAEFYVFAWRGPKVKTEFANAVLRPIGPGPGSGGGPAGGRSLWWAIAALAVVVVGTLAALARRRSAAVALLLLAIVGPTWAQEGSFEARLAAVEGRIESMVEVYNENFDKAKAEIREGLGDVNDRIDQNEANIERIVEQYDENFAKARSEIRGVENSLQELSLLVADEVGSLRSAIEALQLLAEEDRAAIPDPSFGGAPPMVSSCYDNADCAACFERTHAALNEQLDYYSQLGTIFRSADAYLVAMTGYGDATSGWHQLEQAQWYQEKQKIVASHEKLKTAYRNKLEQFNGQLLRILNEYGDCESRYGLDDWYNRYGWPFYQALTASYRIP